MACLETPTQNNRSMNLTIWGGAIILVSGLSAIAFPLTTYAVTLATFGIAHVAIELRYIDSQFHSRLDSKIETRLVLLLLAIAILRCCSIFGTIAPNIAHLLELGCGLGLVLVATHQLWTSDWKRSSIGIIIACLLGIGIVKDPIVTSVIFAIAHNLTPIGFILERQQFKTIYALWICGLLFGLLPVLILVYQLFPIVNLPLETNSIYLSAFIAPAWQKLPIAYPLFSAVTFLQCLHYAVVIGLFSQWTPKQTDSLIPWFAPKYFYLSVGIILTIFIINFQHSFVLTRAFYGVVASIHAWLEIPLLIMLTNRKQHIRTKLQTGRMPD
jgi:hypothetical protein